MARDFYADYEVKTPEASKILEYWKVINASQDKDVIKRSKQRPIERLLIALNNEDAKPIGEWKLKDYVAFFETFYLNRSTIKDCVFKVKNALKYAGIDDSECEASKIVNNISLSDEYILSFRQLYEILNDVVSENNNGTNPDMVFDAYTSSKVLLCLAWFGLSQSEIANVRIGDVDFTNKRIRYIRDGKSAYIDISGHNIFLEFLSTYCRINGIYRKNSKAETGYCFATFKAFGKDAPLLRNTNVDLVSINAIALKAKKYFGLSFGHVQESGLLSSLYQYELSGGDMSNSEAVLKILNKKPTSDRKYLYDKNYAAFKKQAEESPNQG